MNATRRVRNKEAERQGARHGGELKKQNCVEREGKDREPQAGVFKAIAAPCIKTSVAGVSMETGDAQTEDEQAIKFARNEILPSHTDVLHGKIRHGSTRTRLEIVMKSSATERKKMSAYRTNDKK